LLRRRGNEVRAVNPQSMHDDPELPRYRDPRLAIPVAPGNGEPPLLQRTWRSAPREQDARRFEE